MSEASADTADAPPAVAVLTDLAGYLVLLAEPDAGHVILVAWADVCDDAGAAVVGQLPGEATVHSYAADDAFLEYRPGRTYDRVIARPPLGGGLDACHVTHLLACLKLGGLLVGVVSRAALRPDTHATEEFGRILACHQHEVFPLPAGTVRDAAGAAVDAAVLRLWNWRPFTPG